MSTVPKKQTGLLCKHCCAVKIGICQTVMRHELIFPIPMNWNPWGWPGDKSMLSMMLWVAPFDLCHLKPSQKIGTLVDRPTEHCSFVVRCKALRHVLLAAFIPKLSCRPAFEGQSFEPSCRLSSNCMVNTCKEMHWKNQLQMNNVEHAESETMTHASLLNAKSFAMDKPKVFLLCTCGQNLRVMLLVDFLLVWLNVVVDGDNFFLILCQQKDCLCVLVVDFC